jgi:beta-mannosidase
VRNSPSGGDFPFQSDADVTHAYGVGAYQRPLEDARRANVRFAAECLAFANVPDAATLALLPGGAVPAVHHPTWKQRVPRDNGAAWDFEDTRDHYLAQLYRVDPAQLRAYEPERYLQLSRAVSAEVIFATLTEWRRAGSTCRGALVFLLQDLWPGAGWGLIDSTGRPKAALHGFARASQPIAVFFSDEGLNGLHLHVANDLPSHVSGTLHLHLLRDGHVPISQVEAKVELPAHHTRAFPAHALLPGFLDTTYAYRFGPPAYDVAVATLTDRDGAVLSQQLHWPLGRPAQPTPGVTVTAQLEGRVLHLRTDRALHAVHIEDPHFRAAEDYFHLSPLHPRSVELLPTDSSGAAPDGEVFAISLARPVRYRRGSAP